MIIDQNIKAKIEAISETLEFDRIGFAPIKKLTKNIENYKQWISDGKHGDMQWMENNIDKREDPSLLFPNTKSVIVLLQSYHTGKEHENKDGFGKLARYSWGKDYHKLLKKKLVKFQRELENIIPGIKTRSFVDTGPVLERNWAVEAGLGWQAKNTLLINRKLGSYFFISVIFTDLFYKDEIKIVQDHCGKCRKCVDACPTNALNEYTLDARKCISFWTIESKSNEIPEEISKNQSGWLFGCDICQEVCPWNNHRVPISDNEYFFPRNNERELDLIKLQNFSEEDFKIRFENSPLKRPKFEGIKRNIRSLLAKS